MELNYMGSLEFHSCWNIFCRLQFVQLVIALLTIRLLLLEMMYWLLHKFLDPRKWKFSTFFRLLLFSSITFVENPTLNRVYWTAICKAKWGGFKDTLADDILAPVLKVRYFYPTNFQIIEYFFELFSEGLLILG